MTHAGARPYAWMLCGCFWFSLMVLLTHALRDRCDWQTIAVVRSGLATLFALAVAVATGARLVLFRPAVLWVRSVAGSCSMMATFYALTRLPASDVLTLTNTFPMWVAVLSWPLAGERPTVGVWAAVVCAVAGVAVTQRPEVSGLPPAAWAALAGSFFTAVAMLGLNRLHGVSSLGVVVHFSAVSTLFGGASFFLFDRGTGSGGAADGTVLAELLGVGVTATIGQVCLTVAFRTGAATKVSVVGLSQVVMVMAFEAAAGWKQFDGLSVAGTLLVLGPTAWLMARARRQRRADDEPVVEEVATE